MGAGGAGGAAPVGARARPLPARARSTPARPLGVSLGASRGGPDQLTRGALSPAARLQLRQFPRQQRERSTRSSAIAGPTGDGGGGGGSGRARARRLALAQQRTRCPAHGRDAAWLGTGPTGRLDGSGAGGGCRPSEWGEGGRSSPSLSSREAGGSGGDPGPLRAQRPRLRSRCASSPLAQPGPGTHAPARGERAGEASGCRVRAARGASRGGDPQLRPSLSPCPPAAGWDRGRREPCRWSTWGETENAAPPDPVPTSESLPCPFSRALGTRSRDGSGSRVPPPLPSAFSARVHLPSAAPPPRPCPISSAFLFPAARGGLPGRPLAGSRAAFRRQTLYISASPFCVKLERWEASETHSHLAPSPKPGRPGRSLAPSASPRGGSWSPGTKAATPRPRQPGARELEPRSSVRHRGSRPPPFLALRACPGGPVGAGALPGPPWRSPGDPRPPHHLLILCWAVKPLGRDRRRAGCAMERAAAGGGESRALPSWASKEAFVCFRRGLLPGSAGHSAGEPVGGRDRWGGSPESFF